MGDIKYNHSIRALEDIRIYVLDGIIDEGKPCDIRQVSKSLAVESRQLAVVDVDTSDRITDDTEVRNFLYFAVSHVEFLQSKHALKNILVNRRKIGIVQEQTIHYQPI